MYIPVCHTINDPVLATSGQRVPKTHALVAALTEKQAQ
jgi:hypothetical protein